MLVMVMMEVEVAVDRTVFQEQGTQVMPEVQTLFVD
jgi:hypothetical protein